MTYAAIITKYHGPTNTRGSRISATWGNDRCSVPYPHAESSGSPKHRVAAEALLRKLGHEHLIPRLEAGELPGDGYAFVIRQQWPAA